MQDLAFDLCGAVQPPSFPSVNSGVKVKYPDEYIQPQEEWILSGQERVIGGNEHGLLLERCDIPDEINDMIVYSPANIALAGGALRDIANCETVSDWDLFTNMSFDAAVSFLNKDSRVTELTQITTGVSGADYTGSIRYVLQFFIEGVDEPVQLIGVDNVQRHILTEFGVGACRIMYDHKGFSYTQSFARDMYHERFTILNATTLTQKWVHKIKTKYPKWGWKV